MFDVVSAATWLNVRLDGVGTERNGIRVTSTTEVSDLRTEGRRQTVGLVHMRDETLQAPTSPDARDTGFRPMTAPKTPMSAKATAVARWAGVTASTAGTSPPAVGVVTLEPGRADASTARCRGSAGSKSEVGRVIRTTPSSDTSAASF